MYTSTSNPILADARKSLARSKNPAYTARGAIHVAIAFGVDAIKYAPERGITQAHVDHAREVRNKLKGVYGI